MPSTGTYGIRISRPGYDVLTCTQDQLLLNSDVGLLRILAKGSVSTYPGGPTSLGVDLTPYISNGQDPGMFIIAQYAGQSYITAGTAGYFAPGYTNTSRSGNIIYINMFTAYAITYTYLLFLS